jgi:BirA family transcriptional regulator, biotin operon repressor / biotin---[acetyl-CoA-carboxylase] ligase
MELLNSGQILGYLYPEARAQLDELVILETVDSTNDYLLRLAHRQQVIACFAEQQTAGKGQRGKRWLSPPNGQIYFSVLWPFNSPPAAIMGLSLAAGVAAARALHNYGVTAGIAVKWPNDVYYQNQKLAGILVETAPGTQGVYNVVIGIGINLYLGPEQAKEIDQPWASLHQILQHDIERNHFAGILMNEVLLALRKFSAEGLTPFLAEWHTLDYLYGKQVTLTSAQQTLTGIMNGVSRSGELLLVDDQQRQHTCLNGTVRLATAIACSQ